MKKLTSVLMKSLLPIGFAATIMPIALTSCDDPKPNNATIDFTGLNVNYESSV
jgi:hypothetical protein